MLFLGLMLASIPLAWVARKLFDPPEAEQPETVLPVAPVSGNAGRLGQHNNADWEQDAPYPECFEEAQDDDL